MVLFYPLGYAIYLSFFRYSLGDLPIFNGMGNCTRVLGETDFGQAIAKSAVFTGIVAGAQLILGLAVALLAETAHPELV